MNGSKTKECRIAIAVIHKMYSCLNDTGTFNPFVPHYLQISRAALPSHHTRARSSHEDSNKQLRDRAPDVPMQELREYRGYVVFKQHRT